MGSGKKEREKPQNMHLIDCAVKRELLGSYQKKIDSDLMFLHKSPIKLLAGNHQWREERGKQGGVIPSKKNVKTMNLTRATKYHLLE